MREIDQVTLWDLNDLFEYWQNHPPVHVLVAAYLGIDDKNSVGAKSRARKTNKFDDLSLAVAAAGGRLNNSLPEVYKHGFSRNRDRS